MVIYSSREHPCTWHAVEQRRARAIPFASIHALLRHPPLAYPDPKHPHRRILRDPHGLTLVVEMTPLRPIVSVWGWAYSRASW